MASTNFLNNISSDTNYLVDGYNWGEFTQGYTVPFICFYFYFSCCNCMNYLILPGRGSVNREQSEDYPNELGSTHSLNREDGVELRTTGDFPLGADQHWEMNYHEAAIFLEVSFIQENDILPIKYSIIYVN